MCRHSTGPGYETHGARLCVIRVSCGLKWCNVCGGVVPARDPYCTATVTQSESDGTCRAPGPGSGTKTSSVLIY